MKAVGKYTEKPVPFHVVSLKEFFECSASALLTDSAKLIWPSRKERALTSKVRNIFMIKLHETCAVAFIGGGRYSSLDNYSVHLTQKIYVDHKLVNKILSNYWRFTLLRYSSFFCNVFVNVFPFGIT